MKTEIKLSNNVVYKVGDILIRDLEKNQNDEGVNRWGLGKNTITGFKTVLPNDVYYRNKESFINFVIDNGIRFSEHQILAYFKKIEDENKTCTN